MSKQESTEISVPDGVSRPLLCSFRPSARSIFLDFTRAEQAAHGYSAEQALKKHVSIPKHPKTMFQGTCFWFRHASRLLGWLHCVASECGVGLCSRSRYIVNSGRSNCEIIHVMPVAVRKKQMHIQMQQRNPSVKAKCSDRPKNLPGRYTCSTMAWSIASLRGLKVKGQTFHWFKLDIYFNNLRHLYVHVLHCIYMIISNHIMLL